MPEGENIITRIKEALKRTKHGAGQGVPDTTPKVEYAVSNRKYEEVLKGLRIPGDYFSSESRVLSVGEGLSDFASVLHQKGINIIALDPIYSLGKELFGKSVADTKKIIEERYSGRIRFIDYRFDEKAASGQLEEPLVAGDVYSMPFPDGSLTNILGYKIFEHVDLSRALPEMVRVLADGGEIRLGGVMLAANPKERKLLPGFLEFDSLSGSFYLVKANNIKEAFSKLSADNSLRLYVILDELHRRHWVRETGAYMAGVMIIRKDTVTPSYLPFFEGEEVFVGAGERYSFLGKMYEVDFSNFIPSQGPIYDGYYKLRISPKAKIAAN